MAIPDTWSKANERVRWQASTGAWERIESWRGLAGVGGATYATWLANFVGYTSLSYDKVRPGDDGEAEMTVEIGFATDQSGTVLPPTDPNYGLIERAWESDTNKEQRDIYLHPDVDLLIATDQTWPGRIRKAVQAYNQAYREWQKRIETAWAALDPTKAKDPNTNRTLLRVDEPPPNITWYLDFAIPYKNDGSGSHVDYSLEQLDTHTWMFRRYLDDINARYPYYVPVMRKTDTVIPSASAALWASNLNVGRIHTYSSFLIAEPSLVLAVLLNAGQYSEWYWIKEKPVVSQTSQGWFRVRQDWVGIEHPTPDDIKVSRGPII